MDGFSRFRASLVDRGVGAGPVIGAIPGEHGHWFVDLVEQRPDLSGIVAVAVGQRGRNDPAALRIHAEVQLPVPLQSLTADAGS